MERNHSTALYPHPFSKAYWRDAAAELKSTRMLVFAALLTALRIALKPVTIPLGPQLTIPVAMLATALGAMIYGPVMAIPAAIISDTLGFLVFPTGDYFLPFVLTEIASTMIYALCLYRTKLTTFRVVLARFFICFFVNCILQTLIFSLQYVYMGNPEGAKHQILGIFTVARIFKNLAFFPLESIVLTVFLKVLLPACRQAKLIFDREATLKFTRQQVGALVSLCVVGVSLATGYFYYRYSYKGTSRTADYSKDQRVEMNKTMTNLILDKTDDWDDQKVYCVIDGAYRGLFQKETDYTVSIYILDEEAFAAGQADAKASNRTYNEDTFWGYSKSGPKKDKYHSLVKVGTATFNQNEKSGEITGFQVALPKK